MFSFFDFSLIAKLIAVFHAFVILYFMSAFILWGFLRNDLPRWFHISVVLMSAFAVPSYIFLGDCPINFAENYFRALSGGEAYSTSFIVHYTQEIIGINLENLKGAIDITASFIVSFLFLASLFKGGGDRFLDLEKLKSLDACDTALKWFEGKFKKKARLSKLIKVLHSEEENKDNWIAWLLAQEPEMTNACVKFGASIHVNDNWAFKQAVIKKRLEVAEILNEKDPEVYKNSKWLKNFVKNRDYKEFLKFFE